MSCWLREYRPRGKILCTRVIPTTHSPIFYKSAALPTELCRHFTLQEPLNVCSSDLLSTVFFYGAGVKADSSPEYWEKTRLKNLVRHTNGCYFARLYVNGKEIGNP